LIGQHRARVKNGVRGSNQNRLRRSCTCLEKQINRLQM
jgi:hypothetical protein